MTKNTDTFILSPAQPKGHSNLEKAEALIDFYLNRLAEVAHEDLQRDKGINILLIKTLSTLVGAQKSISETYQRQEQLNYSHLSNAELIEALSSQLQELKAKEAKALPKRDS